MRNFIILLTWISFTHLQAQKVLYYGVQSQEAIYKMNTDGSDHQRVLAKISPKDLQLDVNGAKFIWSDANNQNIQRANLDGSGIEVIIDNLAKPTGITLNEDAGLMYFVDSTIIYSANLDGTNIETVYDIGVETADIVFDLTNHIYWADINSRIGKLNLDSKETSIIHTRAFSAEELEIDVDDEKLILAQNAGVGQNSGVYIMNLDGTGKRRLDPDRTTILALEVDPINNQIYYGEFIFNNIHRVDYAGNEVDVFDNGSLPFPKDIIVTTHMPVGENKLYYVDLAYGDFLFSANLDGTSNQVIASSPLFNPAGLVVDKVGDKLIYVNEKSGFINDRTSSIYSSNLDGTAPKQLFSYDDLRTPHDIIFDPINRLVYLSSGSNIYSFQPDGQNLQTIIENIDGAPRSLALDLENETIYWTNPFEDKIQSSLLTGGLVTDLVTDVDVLSGLALNLENKRLYWSQLNEGTVSSSNLDGTDIQILHADLRNPRGLTVDGIKEKLYVCSDRLVFSSNLDGSNFQELNIEQARSAEYITLHNTGDGSSTKDELTTYSINIFPNPASNAIEYEITDGKGILELISPEGLLITKQAFNVGTNHLELVGITPGIYVLKFMYTNSKIYTHKLLITE